MNDSEGFALHASISGNNLDSFFRKEHSQRGQRPGLIGCCSASCLKGFKKVFLQPGESKKVTIALDRRSLAYYDVSAQAWDVARGVYRILVGSSSQDIGLQGAVLNLFPAQLSVLKSTRVMCSNRDRNKQKLLHRALEAFHKRQPGQCWMNQLPIPAVPEIQLEQT